MKIIRAAVKAKPTPTFCTIEAGTVFRMPQGACLLMKMVHYEMKGGDLCVSRRNAVYLHSGGTEEIGNNNTVIPVCGAFVEEPCQP